MTVRNNFEKLGALWMSRGKESAQGVYRNYNLMRLPWNVGSRIVLDRDRIDDRDKMNGYEGPAQIIEAQRKASGSISMDMASPDFIAFILAFFCGGVVTADYEDPFYNHFITINPEMAVPTFTGYQKHGDGVYTEKFAGMAVNSFSIEIGSPWIKASCNLVGLGKSLVDYVKATDTLSTPTTLILPPISSSNDGQIRSDGPVFDPEVAGSTEAERLSNIHRLRIKTAGGIWYSATPTGYSLSPGTVTFQFAGGELQGDEEFEIYYINANSDEWKTPPEINQESPLKLAQASLLINGDDDLNLDWYGLTIMGESNLTVENLPGSGKIYASRIVQGQRILTIKLSQQARDCLLAADIDESATLSLGLTIIGAESYQVYMEFPLVGILKHEFESNGKLLGQRGDLIALHDPSLGIIGDVRVVNKGITYAKFLNQIQSVTFYGTITEGHWHLTLGEETTANLGYAVTSTDVKNALQALTGIDEVTVTGNMSEGFVIEFTGEDSGKRFGALTVDITALVGATDAQIDIIQWGC